MNLSVRLPEHGRPRERLLRHGAAALSDAELLAIALRTGLPGLDVLNLGNQLLDRFSGLRGLLGATPEELLAVPGLGAAKACMLAAVLELARRAIEEDLTRDTALDHPGASSNTARPRWATGGSSIASASTWTASCA